MAKRIHFSQRQHSKFTVCKFGQASFDLLTDFLVNINTENKNKLDCLSKCSGAFKDENVIEYIFLITNALTLDPQVGYHALELLERFMTTHLIKLLTTPTPQGAAAAQPISYEDAVLDTLQRKFPFIIFSCIQLASKMSLHTNIIDNNTALRFLRSVGYNASKKALLNLELMVLKGLDFKLDVCNPLTYVETILEVLGYNEPSIPIERTYELCQQVLQFVVLEKTAIYDSLLMVTTQCQNPSFEQSMELYLCWERLNANNICVTECTHKDQTVRQLSKLRERFSTVTEDCMLLGVAVVAVALYIFHISQWEKVVEELSNITGISKRSIIDFAHVTLLHIVDSPHL